MVRLPALLVRAEDLSDDCRWRMVGALYGPTRSLVEGSISQVLLVLICFWRTGWSGYAFIAGAVLITAAARLRALRQFNRRLADRQAVSGAPEHWARRFVTGAGVAGALWGLTTASTCLLFDDVPLQALVLAMQAGWISGATARNSASPAAIAIVLLTTTLPSVVATLLTHSALLHCIAPFLLLQLGPNVSVARSLGAQFAGLLRSEQRLESANARLMLLSATDGLTGIGNRRAFDAALQREWDRAARDGTSLGLLIADIDHFKCYNDCHGHMAGDDCLRMIAEIIEQAFHRPSDFVGRYGGEEFVGIMPGTDASGVFEVAERLRAAVVAAHLPHGASPFRFVTVSIGVACMTPRLEHDPRTLIAQADEALYQAKRTGRNKVSVSADSMAHA